MPRTTNTPKTFRGLHAVIARSDEKERLRTETAIRDFGIPSVKSTASAANLYLEAKTNGADLLVADAHMDEKGLIRFIRDVRHGLVGNNPFVSIVIVLDDHADERLVRSFMSSGVDVILLRTTPAETLQSKLFDLAHSRKPFTTGTTYIGPERRKGSRVGKLFPVPTLQNVHDRRRIHDTFRAIQTDRAELVARRIFQIVSAPNGGSRLAAGQILPLCDTMLTLLSHTPHKRTSAVYETIRQLVGTDGPRSEGDLKLSQHAAQEGARVICGPSIVPSLPTTPFRVAQY